MLDILAITGPIYAVIALGYAAVRRGGFTREHIGALGRFVIGFALPALLFNALAHRPLAGVLDPVYLVAFGAASVLILIGAFAYARKVRHRSAPESAFIGMGMSFPNSGFVGYPIVLQFLGPPAGVALALSMLVENLVMLPLALALADGGGSGRWHRAFAQGLRRVAVNPLVLAILAGFAVSLAGVALPGPVTRTIDVFAQASTAVALFVIGGSLVGLEVRGMARDVATIAAGKLLLHPLAVVAMLALLPPLDPALRAACIAYACMPMLSVYPILAQKHGLGGPAAAALLVTTVASLFTVSAALWLLGPVR